MRSLYTSGKAYGNLVLQTTLPGVKRPLCMANTFLGKCASITAVDQIQQKKVPGSFCESHLAEARFEIILIPTVLLEYDGS